jgi:uncharacterized protein YneF (UPF0154 family)
METIVTVGVFLLSITACCGVADFIGNLIDARQAKKNLKKN